MVGGVADLKGCVNDLMTFAAMLCSVDFSSVRYVDF